VTFFVREFTAFGLRVCEWPTDFFGILWISPAKTKHQVCKHVSCIHTAEAKCEKFPVHSPHHIQCRFTIQQVCIAESMLSMLRSNSVNRHLLYMRTHRSCLLSENNGLRKTFKWKTRRKLTNRKLYAAVTHHREVAIRSTII